MLTRLYRQCVDDRGELEEVCFYVESSEQLSPDDIQKFVWLMDLQGVSGQSDLSGDLVVEVGPRLSVETPFSSNAVSMCHAMGLTHIMRIERSERFQIMDGTNREQQLALRMDRMTQEVYGQPLTSFETGIVPAEVQVVPVLERGRDAIRLVNAELGLGMDDWDINLYTDLFTRLGRDPTDVELFQIGNANSEHSRHHFFKGKMVIDGEVMAMTLLELIQAPLKALGSDNSNRVLAFNDNAGAIRGYEVKALIASKPGDTRWYELCKGRWHITCTAETHNHPTLVAPYPGAETGTGGRIRDNSAAGRGSLPLAGVAGYCVGNLYLSAHEIPGERIGGEDLVGTATPLRILIEASNGCSDYGNRFGEPVIGGFCRTFGLIANGERREFRKPILYSGGVGRMWDIHAEKREPKEGMLVIRIGGPAYRIGVGGGSASSMMQGQNAAELDFNSVQRGNAEMENRANRVIRACIGMGKYNPIQSIHDQGAGGPSNVLTELLEPAGGKLDIRQINLGDKTMSVLEIWSAEYQEGYGLLLPSHPEHLGELQSICARERVNCEVMGEITGDGHVTVVDSRDESTPVHLNLQDILSDIPQKTFEFDRKPRALKALELPEGLRVADALALVLRLPQVGSKGFLTRKVDRSVSGLIARQQCCGPTQVPVADVSVTADGYFDTSGAAMAIGEQPNKMLIDPKAGARMAVGEMLTNLASARISDLGHVSCRANWMWPAKLEGEGALLYDAADAMSNLMIELGIACDGGKDSLSMAATVNEERVKSPGQLVVLGYAPVPDIRHVVTPDFKRPGQSRIGLIDLGFGRNRLGGSSLAQAYGQLGSETPDLDMPSAFRRAFRVVQQLISMDLLLSIHDRSDGGLITTLVEMCLAGNCGAHISIDDKSILASLFNEELGFVLEYAPENEEAIRAIIDADGLLNAFKQLGETRSAHVLTVGWHLAEMDAMLVLNATLKQLRQCWEATSDQLELLQADPTTVNAERASYGEDAYLGYNVSFQPQPTDPNLLESKSRHRVAILREEGTNGDREMAAAFFAAGLDPWDLTMSDLLDGFISPDNFRGVVFPGGFSYMDVLGSAKGWAGSIRFSDRVRSWFARFFERSDTFSLGVCNGCQLMALLGWIPYKGLKEKFQPRFVQNTSKRFESRWTHVQITESPSILLRDMEGSRLGVWVAHGEGRLMFPDLSILDSVQSKSLAPMAFVDPDGKPTETYPFNPNGSVGGLTSLCSPDGRHLAMMPHPERCFQKWQWPWMPKDQSDVLAASPWLRMFQNAREWCDSTR